MEKLPSIQRSTHALDYIENYKRLALLVAGASESGQRVFWPSGPPLNGLKRHDRYH